MRLVLASAAAGLVAGMAVHGHAFAQAPAPAQGQVNISGPATADQGAGAQLRSERRLGSARGTGPARGAAFARAGTVRGESQDKLVLEGNAEVRADGAVLRGDRVTYTAVTDELDVEGNARLFRDGTLFTGPSLRYRLDAQTGEMPEANFTYAPRGARGSARLMEFLGPETTRLRGATFTTCAPGDESWWVKAETIDIDRVDELATARSARLYFKDVPIFASPYFQIPLGDQRRSGVLTPSIGIDSRSGWETTVPIYWNIAPNRDYTLSPRVMTRRGVLLQNELRFLEPTVRGLINYDVIPQDRSFGDARDSVSARGEYAGPSGLVGGINYNRVSDDRFLADFGNNLVTASNSILQQDAFVGFNRTYWNTAVRVNKNQTLQDPTTTIATDKPYERVPQLTFNLLGTDVGGFDLRMGTEVTRFEHPTKENGTRAIVNPSIAYPLLAPGGFFVPRVQWHSTRYSLDPELRPGAASLSRNLAITSLDAGLVFERDASWYGRDVLQTLEPRLFYAYVPYRDQSSYPLFDTAYADFNFSQLFNENVFVGGDRIGEANQLTTALVGRIIEPDSGAERLRAAVGQRFYFSSQRVTLGTEPPRTNGSSDLLFGLSGLIARGWITDLGVQYSTEQAQVVRASAGIRYQPRAASVVSLAYRYKALPTELGGFEQYDLAAQWPLTQRWYGVGRINYDVRRSGWIETIAGLEYKADCWVLRMAAHRFVTSAQTTTTQVFIALELNGLGSVGTSPLDQLRRNIPGYQVINPLPQSAGRFDYYE